MSDTPRPEPTAPAGPPGGGRGNLLALALTRLVLATSGMVVNVAVARWLSREDFGTYRWVWAVVALGTFLSNLGLWQLVTRQVAEAPDRAGELVAVSLRATWRLSWLTTALVTGYVAVADGRPEIVLTAFLGGLTLAWTATAQMVQAALHGLRRMFLEVSAVLAGRVVFVATHLVLLGLGCGVVWLYAGRVAAAWVTFVMLVVQFRRHVGTIPATVPAGAVTAFLAMGPTFAASVLFGSISAQADVVMMEALRDHDEVARYAAPASVLLQLAFVANIVSRGFFPSVSRLGKDPAALAPELVLQSRMLLLLAMPMVVGGAVVAGPLVDLVFGPRYHDAVVPFVLLLLTTPVRFLNNGYGFTMIALDRTPERARIDMVAAVFNVVANLLAIPWLGAEGAAVTTLLTDVVCYVLMVRAIRASVPGYRVLGPLVRTAVPALAMGVVVAALPDLAEDLGRLGDVSVHVLLGVAVYVPLAWLTRAWRPADLRRLARI